MGWFVLTLTDSPFLVGAISAVRISLNLLALFAGAVADRVSKQRVLATVEFLMAAFAGVMIFLLAMTTSIVRVFEMPSSQALVSDTLPEDRIANGAAFNTLGRNIAMPIGPLVGDVLFKGFGPRGAFIAIAALYMLSGWVALYVNREEGQAKHRSL